MLQSTGFNNQMLGLKPPREILKDFVVKCYGGGAIPTSADAIVTGTLLNTLTVSGATAKVKQKITITPVIGDASADVWSVTLNGQTVSFTDAGGPASVASVCTGLSNALKVLNGTAITTPASTLSIPDCEGLFTITDNTTNVTVEAATAGVSFTYSSTVTGATTASLTSVLTTDSAYGIRWEEYSNVASSILEKLSGDEWSGAYVVDGTILYARICADDDTGAASTTLPRLQLTVATANQELNITQISGVIGEVVRVSSLAELYF